MKPISPTWIRGLYKPRAPQLFQKHGAVVTAVDIADLSGEPFYKTHQLDMRDPDALSVVPTDSMDVIEMHSVIDCLTSQQHAMRLIDPFVSHLRRILRASGTLVTNNGAMMQRYYQEGRRWFCAKNDVDTSTAARLQERQDQLVQMITEMLGPQPGHQM